MDIVVLPGDGIGEEIIQAGMTVLEAVDTISPLGLTYQVEEIGFASYDKTGTTLPDRVLERCRNSDGIILGPVSHMDYPDRDKGGVNVSAVVRVALDLYANVRPARTRKGLPNKVGDFDLVIMREATEGFYPDRNMFAGKGEFMPTEDVVISMRKLTRGGCSRIARRAFELAMTRRKKVTAIHKANNFIMSDGLFLEEVRKVARDFPEVEVEEMIIDASAAILVRDPARFDVICATNFHADILSDLTSELSGSLGLAGSINAGETLCCAQAQHGSAPDIAGQDKANPTSMILSIAMLLDWLGNRHGRDDMTAAAARLDSAIDTVLADPASRTADLGGTLGTQAFAKVVADVVAG